MKKKHSLFLVEDHAIYRMGLKELIKQEDDLFVCGEADNTREAWERIKDIRPDMVILDLSLRDGNGISLIKNIKKYDKDIPVLVLSMYDESLYAERSIAAGASGYIMKQEASETIVRIIRHILQGNIYVSERITASILYRHLKRTPSRPGSSPGEILTDRELEVFHHIGCGCKAGEIARRMNLSVRTIGTYRERIKEKLDLKSAADVAKHAALWIEENDLNHSR